MVDDLHLRSVMLALLAATRDGTTLCPSQVARSLAHEERAWRSLMPRVRDCARALAREGALEVTQRGTVLSPDDDWKGAVRLRRSAAAIRSESRDTSPR